MGKPSINLASNLVPGTPKLASLRFKPFKPNSVYGSPNKSIFKNRYAKKKPKKTSTGSGVKKLIFPVKENDVIIKDEPKPVSNPENKPNHQEPAIQLPSFNTNANNLRNDSLTPIIPIEDNPLNQQAPLPNVNSFNFMFSQSGSPPPLSTGNYALNNLQQLQLPKTSQESGVGQSSIFNTNDNSLKNDNPKPVIPIKYNSLNQQAPLPNANSLNFMGSQFASPNKPYSGNLFGGSDLQNPNIPNQPPIFYGNYELNKPNLNKPHPNFESALPNPIFNPAFPKLPHGVTQNGAPISQNQVPFIQNPNPNKIIFATPVSQYEPSEEDYLTAPSSPNTENGDCFDHNHSLEKGLTNTLPEIGSGKPQSAETNGSKDEEDSKTADNENSGNNEVNNENNNGTSMKYSAINLIATLIVIIHFITYF